MSLSLNISSTALTEIIDHARRGYPAEVCGLIGGRDQVASIVVPIPNISSTPHIRFEMDRRTMVNTIVRFQQAGLDVVGIYHSHPDEAPIPSLTDISEATWPDTVYLIVGLVAAEAPTVWAWTIRCGRALPAELNVIADAKSANG